MPNIEMLGLNQYCPFDEREQLSLDRFISLIENLNNDIFDQTKNTHHITGSAFVLSRAGLLLHFHKKIHRWLQPGGHLEAGESPLEAASRETQEETGVRAQFEKPIFHIDVHDTPSGHIHYDVRFLARAESLYLCPPQNESQKVAWFSSNALASVSDPAMIGAVQKLFDRNLIS